MPWLEKEELVATEIQSEQAYLRYHRSHCGHLYQAKAVLSHCKVVGRL